MHGTPEPTVQRIGSSFEGRAIDVWHTGNTVGSKRVLVIAGQHGDEGGARQAVGQFFADFNHSDIARAIHLAVLPSLNPDGAARKSRTNAEGVDLNRDHQTLHTAEVFALHRFVREWRPQLILDVHTYPSHRAHLMRHGLVHCHDVFMDRPNTPGLRDADFGIELPGLMNRVFGQTEAKGYSAARYVLATQAGRIRHSTTDVLDARNGLALRYGIPCVLVEGRKARKQDDRAERVRVRTAVHSAIESTLREWLAAHAVPIAGDSGEIAVRSRYERSPQQCLLPLKELATGEVRQRGLPGVFCPSVRVTRRVRLPAAYAVPLSLPLLIVALRRHGFSERPSEECGEMEIERYQVRDTKTLKPRRRRSPRLVIDRVRERGALKGHAIFPVDADGGRALAVYLEPESKYGLHRFAEMGLSPNRGSLYPVIRIDRFSTSGK